MQKPSKINLLLAGALCTAFILPMDSAQAQRRKAPEKPAQTTPAQDTTKTPANSPAGNRGPGAPGANTGPRPFSAVITNAAKADSGLLHVYAQQDRYFLQIPDPVLGKDILIVTRLSKSAVGLRSGMMGFGGDQINELVVRFERGPKDRIFLRKISYSERVKDSTSDMYHTVLNSNTQPIVASFDIKAYSAGKSGAVIDFTDYMQADNDILFFDARSKSSLGLGAVQNDKSYIVSVQSFPTNVEIKTVKTYTRTPSSGGPGGGGSSMPAGMARNLGNATVEINTSMVILPETLMTPRFEDSRVGYFSTGYTDFDSDPQGVKRMRMITRWKMEPKDEDRERYFRGELVEPKNPIVFYIDPATPKKWVKYLIQGVNDWQIAFEAAGFKNAIVGKMAPTKEEDPTWSLDDARYSAIVYKPSEVPNASGPHVNDPRTGQILESHINWYHNVMKLLRNWYIIQGSPNDERARKLQFDEDLMGELIRFVSSHEVGHTLGLRHNFGSSSTYPVEKLRDPNFVKEHGHAASIMDYARFNYVAQPGDGITREMLYPRINYYDIWAIEWGYRILPNTNGPDDERAALNKWTIERLKDNRLFFGHEMNPDDPRSQNEDLGDNAMKASDYGIRNLKRIVPNLLQWTYQANEGFDALNEIYGEVFTQWGRYAGHVAKNIGGIYETPKKPEQEGPVYEVVPKAIQKEAMAFLQKEVFKTPTWLINQEVVAKLNYNVQNTILARQDNVLRNLLSSRMLFKLINAETANPNSYGVIEMMNDLRRGIFSELASGSKIDVYRRNLQKAYLGYLVGMVAPASSATPNANNPSIPRNDAASIARGQLNTLRSELRAAGGGDTLTRYHIQELIAQINIALDNK